MLQVRLPAESMEPIGPSWVREASGTRRPIARGPADPFREKSAAGCPTISTLSALNLSASQRENGCRMPPGAGLSSARPRFRIAICLLVATWHPSPPLSSPTSRSSR